MGVGWAMIWGSDANACQGGVVCPSLQYRATWVRKQDYQYDGWLLHKVSLLLQQCEHLTGENQRKGASPKTAIMETEQHSTLTLCRDNEQNEADIREWTPISDTQDLRRRGAWMRRNGMLDRDPRFLTSLQSLQQVLNGGSCQSNSCIAATNKRAWIEGEAVLYANKEHQRTPRVVKMLNFVALILGSPKMGAMNTIEYAQSKANLP